MKNRTDKLRLALFVAAAFSILGAYADTARLVVFQCPPGDADEVNAELTDIRKRGDEATMASVLKRERVKRLADLMVLNPWRGEAVSVHGLAGKDLVPLLEMDGKNVVVTVTGVRGKAAVRQQTDVEVRVVGKSKNSIRRLSAKLPMVVPEFGQWQQLAAWSDANGPVALWQFSSRDEAAANFDSTKEKESLWRQFRVEFRGFQTARAISSLDGSTPAAAAKSLEALERGSEPWSAGVFSCSLDSRGNSGAIHDHLKNAEVDRRETESVDVSISGKGSDLTADWNVVADYRGRPGPAFCFTAPLVPGVWQFQPVKNLTGINLLAWRITRVDAVLGGLERAGSPKSWTCQLHPDGEAVVARIAGIREGKVALEMGGKTVIHPWESFSAEDQGMLTIWRGVTEEPQQVERGTAVYELTGTGVEKRIEIGFAGPRARIRSGNSEVKLDAVTGHFISERKQADGKRSVWIGRHAQAPEAAWKESGAAPPLDPGALPFNASSGFPGLHLERSCFAGSGEAVEAMVSRIDAPGLLAALRMCFDPLPATEGNGKTSWPSPDVLSRPWLPGSAGQLAVLREAKVLPVAYHRIVLKEPGGGNAGTWKLRLCSLNPVSKVTIDFPADVLAMQAGTLKKSTVTP